MLTVLQVVLAVMPVVTTPVAALPHSDRASSLRHIASAPMTWRIDREIGSESGRKTCFVFSRGGDVIVRLSKDRQAKTATWSVLIGFDNQPGSLRYVRINRKFYTTDKQSFRGPEANEIVELLKLPGELAFEWFKSPDYSKRQGLFGTGDFAGKAAECDRWMNGLRV